MEHNDFFFNNQKHIKPYFIVTWHNWASTAEAKNHLEAAIEVTPRKRLTSLLKPALGLMAGI